MNIVIVSITQMKLVLMHVLGTSNVFIAPLEKNSLIEPWSMMAFAIAAMGVMNISDNFLANGNVFK